MLIDGYNTNELEFVGFFDTCLFKHNVESGGYMFKTKDGKELRFTYGQIIKAMKKEKKQNAKNKNN
jgi:hypothetical protein